MVYKLWPNRQGLRSFRRNAGSSKRPPPCLGDLHAHGLDRLFPAFRAVQERSREPSANQLIEQRKREATREQDGPCAAVRPLGEESKRTTALVTEAGLFHRAHP